MKNYFSFILKGKNLFPFWLLFMALFIAPYVFIMTKIQDIPTSTLPSVTYFLVLFGIIIVAYLITFYFVRLTIENIVFEGKNVEFKGTFGGYLAVFIPGLLLTLITLGIYGAWFVKNMADFFINNSQYDYEKLKFRGKGSKLFVIMLLLLFIPVLIISVILGILMFKNPELRNSSTIILNLIMMIIMIPFYYLFYKWMADIDYKEYHITWETKFWPSCGKIFLEIFLSAITLGIYSPLAMLKLYKYFIDKTVALSENKKTRLGYDSDNLNDFLYIWGQILLTIVTATVYFPWAYCNIGKRIAGKSYLTE